MKQKESGGEVMKWIWDSQACSGILGHREMTRILNYWKHEIFIFASYDFIFIFFFIFPQLRPGACVRASCLISGRHNIKLLVQDVKESITTCRRPAKIRIFLTLCFLFFLSYFSTNKAEVIKARTERHSRL